MFTAHEPTTANNLSLSKVLIHDITHFVGYVVLVEEIHITNVRADGTVTTDNVDS